MELSNKLYDRLKFTVQVVLPGLGALYVGLAAFWPFFKEPTAVAGSIALIAVFLGLFLNRAAVKYGGVGDLVVHYDESDGSSSLSTDLDKDPAQFKDGANVIMNIHRVDIPA